MFLLFERFQPRNVLILFLFSITHSYLLTDMEHFNSTLEESYIPRWKGSSDYITKHDVDGFQITLLKVIFQEKFK